MSNCRSIPLICEASDDKHGRASIQLSRQNSNSMAECKSLVFQADIALFPPQSKSAARTKKPSIQLYDVYSEEFDAIPRLMPLRGKELTVALQEDDS